MTDTADELIDEITALTPKLAEARTMIARRVIGQDAVVESTLIALMCGGHGLLVGVPGLAKTRLVETLGTVMGLDAKRVQFTPDLMPSDILGALACAGLEATMRFHSCDHRHTATNIQ